MRDETKRRIREEIGKSIADGTTAGANFLLLRDGKEEFYEEQGLANREKGVPIRRDTIFRLYSMTKPVTAVAAMILMERGLLDFAQPVSDFLPGFAKLRVEKDGTFVPAQKPVTVHHLLNMTSGLTYGDEETTAGRAVLAYLDACAANLHTPDEVTTSDFANGLGMLPLAFEPDTFWRYGLSADVLGAVIEKASGMRFGDFLKENIFGPLGMEDTDFWVPEHKQERLAYTYETLGDGRMRLYEGEHLLIASRMERRPAYEAGGAGLASTIDDYAKFAQMLLNGGSTGGVRILAPRTVEYLTSGNLLPVQQSGFRTWIGMEGFTYSHFLRIMRDPSMAPGLSGEGEYGWDGWLGCYFANFPKERMTMILMRQKKDSGTTELTRKLRNLVLAEC